MLALALALLIAVDDSPRRVEVQVGKTVEVDVGYAIGVRCDDPALIEVTMTTKDDRNVLAVKGVRAGTTQCRVGNEARPPSVLFDVRVLPSKRP